MTPYPGSRPLRLMIISAIVAAFAPLPGCDSASSNVDEATVTIQEPGEAILDGDSSTPAETP